MIRPRPAKPIIVSSTLNARSLMRRWSRNQARLTHNQEIIRCDSGLRHQFRSKRFEADYSRRVLWMRREQRRERGEIHSPRCSNKQRGDTTRAYNASIRGSGATADALGLNPRCCEFKSRLPNRCFEMGMNAKRSRDRFFKPVLASSSLAIPPRFMAVEPKWRGAGLWNQC